MDVHNLGHLAEAFEAGVLLHKSGGDDARGNRHHAHAQERDADAKGLSQRRHGVDVPVAHRQEGGARPPEAGEGVREDLRLGLVFQTVHTETGP